MILCEEAVSQLLIILDQISPTKCSVASPVINAVAILRGKIGTKGGKLGASKDQDGLITLPFHCCC